MLNKKVYCKDCKWYKTIDSYAYFSSECHKILGMNDTPIRQEKEFAKCDKQNRDNDCKYYEHKRYKFWKK